MTANEEPVVAGRRPVQRLLRRLLTERGQPQAILFGTQQEGTMLPAGRLKHPVEALSGYALTSGGIFRFWLDWDGEQHVLRPFSRVDDGFFESDPEYLAARRKAARLWHTTGHA